MAEMKQLTDEQKRRFSSAIRQGFVTDNTPQYWHSFCGTWVRKHPNRVSTLVRLREILGHNPQWEDVTDDVLSDLKDDMLMQMAPNSVKTICAELKAVLNKNIASKPIKSGTFGNILKAKKVPTQSVYLTKRELQRVYDYKPATDKERYVRNIFLIECVTGARNVDCRKMSLANIHEEDGEEVITYVPDKHPTLVTVPVHRWLKELLSQDYPENIKNILLPHFNETLKYICMKCGIRDKVAIYRAGRTVTDEKWRLISSHTGRKTFCTLLHLSGVGIEDISMMVGHTNGGKPNIEMTYGYICQSKKVGSKIFALFK